MVDDMAQPEPMMIADDYARQVVPEHAASRPARSIALIISNSIMGVPCIILGASIGADYGWSRSWLVIVLGCSVTALIAGMAAFAGVRSRRSTALLAQQAFGSVGASLLNVTMAIALVGWFAVETGFIGDMVATGAADVFGVTIGREAGIVVAASMICLVTISGISLIMRAPLLFLPLLGALLLAVLVLTTSAAATAPADAISGESIGSGVSAIVGTYIVGCLIMPDYSRFIRTPQAAVGATGIALGPIYALVLGTYAAASLATHQNTPAGILAGLGLPAAVALILPVGLLQNGIMCLYSSLLTISTLVKSASWRVITVAVTLVGVALSLRDANGLFIEFLVTLGIVFPPAAALLIYTGLNSRAVEDRAIPRWRISSFVIWCAGVIAGAGSEWFQVGLSGFAALDGFIAAALGASVIHLKKLPLVATIWGAWTGGMRRRA